jgi:Salmonella virulence plasmid 65kDa B protein/Insecticide toxin TcdB middle/C-terminal region/Insecticide toxin TcdB middle/N-terminal region
VEQPREEQAQSGIAQRTDDGGRGRGTGPGPPAISLPKGGGAIRGIGEKFVANPVTGTGSLTVPIAASPDRSGFGPELSLSYDSGAGNGPFGLGWNLSLPSITRKTDKGLPRYLDADESDEFILSGAEDLVPVLVAENQGAWIRKSMQPRTVDGRTYIIERYRPRIEGLFARIERWTDQDDEGGTFWRSISRDNVTTWYGRTQASRVANPEDPTRIFSWLICESHDDKGNVIAYEYESEDSAGVDLSQANEKNRSAKSRSANRHLKRIRYGNHAPYWPALSEQQPWSTPRADGQWFFEVVFDYGEHDLDTPKPDDSGQWNCRGDPFSSYRAGFEIRTYRLCRRVLMFYHFRHEKEVGNDCLVRSTDLSYSYEQTPTDPRNAIHSVLTSIIQSGYQRQSNGYQKKSLPPLEFEYSQAAIHQHVHEVDPESLENLPYGLDNANYRWVDLDGEGLSGILTEQADGWFYKANSSPINPQLENGRERVEARFEAVERVAKKPSLAAIGSGRQKFLDLAGDGQLDLVELDGPTPGFYERTHDERWESFRPFESHPNLDWGDPNLKFVDLTGDGHADILISEHDIFCWLPSLAESGFGPLETVRKALDEEKGPRLVFADSTQSIYLSDMSGDGLIDIARIRNGEVCYWPNLGYGRFGAKVTMDNAPWFDASELFDQRRIRLADTDGSGGTDILYLSSQGVKIYLNQSGNAWAAERILIQFPHIDNLSSIVAVDLLGNGTACLVWSSPLPGDRRQPMRYIDLMGGQKPHLLIKSVNNLGAETRVHYAPSTRFYLQDKEDGKPWITKLPFPVHVVERVETYDHISRNCFVTRYAYHHGYFDGIEREFRGFAMVEQWDAEQFGVFGDAFDLDDTTNLDEASHIPPVVTKTWFHTGAYFGRAHISNFFAGLSDSESRGEYYREPAWRDDPVEAAKRLLDDTVLPAGLTAEEEREACRALKGAMLRQEVYALDGSTSEDYPHGHPYTVTEQNFTIRCLQPEAGNRHAVFFIHDREAISYHYERNPDDPRIGHTLTLEVDQFGNTLKSVAIGYGRRPGQSPLQGDDKKKQERTLMTYTENEVTFAIDGVAYPDDYRAPLPCESRTYEVTGFDVPASEVRFGFKDFACKNKDFQPLVTLPEIEYEQPIDYDKKQKRLIECVRTLYSRDDLSGLLGKCELQPMALPGESYTLAFTPGLLKQVYVRSGQTLLPANPADILQGAADKGGCVDLDGNGHWWIPSGQVFYSQDRNDSAATELAYAEKHFFLPHRFEDPFGSETVVTYDKAPGAGGQPYDLFIALTRDAAGNEVRAEHDYRVLQPKHMIDPNHNHSEVIFDTLGLVAGTAIKGKVAPTGQSESGDSFQGFKPDLTEAQLAAFMNAPEQQASTLLANATTRIVYDLDRFRDSQRAHPNDPSKWQPVYAATLAREMHTGDPLATGGLKVQIGFSYSDGFGREIQTKIQAEPEKIDGVPGPPRWVGSGWTIFNNKGKLVRQYEPFFSQLAPGQCHDFEFGVKVGVSPVLFYDPLERVIATLHPNHTYGKVVFDPWRQTTYDVNE